MIKVKNLLQKKLSLIISFLILAFFTTGFSLPSIHMRIINDGRPMRALKEINGRCLTNDSELLLMFSTVNDPDERIADDELFFNLDIQVDDISQIPLGEPIDIADNSDVNANAGIVCFCIPPQDSLSLATGIITIKSFTENFITGSLILTFRDPTGLNINVDRSLSFWTRFTRIRCNSLE